MSTETQAPDPAPLSVTVATALRRAFNLGQTYWQQADSDSFSQNAKSDITRGKFNELLEETTAAVAAIPAPEGAQLPPLPHPLLIAGGGQSWFNAEQMRAYARAALAAPAPQDSLDSAQPSNQVAMQAPQAPITVRLRPSTSASDWQEMRTLSAAPQTKEPECWTDEQIAEVRAEGRRLLSILKTRPEEPTNDR